MSISPTSRDPSAAPAVAHDTAQPPPLSLRRRMSGRDVHEPHRAASPLELLFDLTTVIAVAAVAGVLHHGIVEGHYASAASAGVMAFFCVWWSWMNFTWFSSAYDTDDIGFRLATMVQIIGVLLIAAGITQDTPSLLTVTLGFAVMRVGLVWLWLRAAREHLERRTTCLRYAGGLVALQMLWVLRALVLPPQWAVASFAVLAALELAVPVWAERAGGTPWHPHHMAERYSLLTIILLGECMVGALNGMRSTLQAHGWSMELVGVSLGVVGLIVGLWWAYFLVPFAQVLHQWRERGFLWGYGHALVFAALALLAGGLEVVADGLKAAPGAHAGGHKAGHGGATVLLAMAITAGAAATYLVTLWWLGGQTTRRQERSFAYLLPSLVVAALSVAAVAWGLPLPWALLLLAASPVVLIARVMHRRHLRPDGFAVR